MTTATHSHAATPCGTIGFTFTDRDVLFHGLPTGHYPSDARSIPAEHVVKCREWLRLFAKPTERITRQHDSYNYKHFVELWSGHYIGSGAFIVAALREGYQGLRTHGDRPDVCFNIRILKGKLRRTVESARPIVFVI
jgi:hypothetical protein